MCFLGSNCSRSQDGVLVAVEKADHLHAVVARLDGDGTDDAVDAGGRAAADHGASLPPLGVLAIT